MSLFYQFLLIAFGFIKGVLSLECGYCLSHQSEAHCITRAIASACEDHTDPVCITLYHKIGGTKTWTKMCAERSMCQERWPCGYYATQCNITCCASIDCNVEDNSAAIFSTLPIYSLASLLGYLLL